MIRTNFLIVFIRNRFVISEKRKNTRKKTKTKQTSRINVLSDWNDFVFCLIPISIVCLAVGFPAFTRFKSDKIVYSFCTA